MSDLTERFRALRKRRISVSGVLLGYVFFICFLLANSVPSQAEERKYFDLEAAPASRSLNEFARQSGMQVGFSPDAIGHIRTNAVKGDFEVDHALGALLAGTGLSPRHGAHGLVIVLDDQSEPAGVHQSPGRAREAEAVPASRFDAAGTSSAPIEEILVTGSHVRGTRNAGVAPITFDRQDLARTGFVTIEELFRSLPQNLDEITPVGAIATGASNLAGFNSQGATGVNLRGLGPGSTLVLLNGERRPGNINGRVVDVSAIPLSMVERVDVVTGGYSAIYGSDAVAGVVNVVTRRSFDGAETEVYYGESDAGGERLNLNQTYGREFREGGFVIGYDFRKDEPLDATDTGVLRLPSPFALSPIPGIFHIRGAAEQHSGLVAAHWNPADHIELYTDAQLSLDDYTNQLAYNVAGCCDVESYIVTDSTQYSVVGGMRFAFGATWGLDVSGLHGRVENAAASGSAVVPEGTVSSADPRPAATMEGDDEAELSSFSVVADGALGSIRGHTVAAAIGLDLRTESYINTTRDLATGTTTVFENIDRDVSSTFAEVHVPLWERGQRHLQLSVAGRYDDYSDFGSTFNPQVGLEWQPTDQFVLRGSFSTAFRAPDLFALSNESRVRMRQLPDPTDPSGATMATVFIRSGGNPDLQPEEADTYTLTVDWQPSDEIAVTLSYFNIEYDDRIDTPDSFSGGLGALENEPLYPGLIDRSPTPESVQSILSGAELVINDTGVPFDPAADDPFDVFSNIVVFDNRTNNISLDQVDGIDAQASFSWQTSAGEWLLGLNATYYLDFSRNITPTAPVISQLNQPGRPVDLKLRSHAGWSGGAWNAHMYVNYVDGYADNTVDPPIPIDSWTTIDLTIGLDLGSLADTPVLSGIDATLGIDNVLDEDPPVFLNNILGLGYDAVNADAIGRFIGLRLSKDW